MSATACLRDEAILAFVQGMLPIEKVSRLEMHLSACSECRSIVAEAANLFTSRESVLANDEQEQDQEQSSSGAQLLPGTPVSRYVISGVIGTGAAGIVYRAYDPELKRYVALKLLRAEHAIKDNSLRARLLREAQAMAQLSHPNVVSVFDVGTFDTEVFVVLELVEGLTLAAWLDQSRSWYAIVSAFFEAGKGLVAAHAVKIVHRDFKPANVLVSVDGRVRVTDFGLARALEFPHAGRDVMQHEVLQAHAPSTNATLTQTGELAGTPIYMAPEQFARKPADERSDQFAFCVALYSALYQSHPYLPPSTRVSSLAELVAALQRGELRVPAHAAAPPALFRVLRTGLSLDPAQRFASMQLLLEELAVVLRDATLPSAGMHRRPRLLVALAVGLALVLAASVALTITWPRRSAPRAQEELRIPTASTTSGSNALREAKVDAQFAAGTLSVAGALGPSPAAPAPTSVSSSAKSAQTIRAPRPQKRSRAPQGQSSAPRPRANPDLQAGLKQYNDGLRDPF